MGLGHTGPAQLPALGLGVIIDHDANISSQKVMALNKYYFKNKYEESDSNLIRFLNFVV
jgi:hypothetical protein